MGLLILVMAVVTIVVGVALLKKQSNRSELILWANGCVLLVFQVLSVLGNVKQTGQMIPSASALGSYSVFYIVGYFLPTIVAIILFYVGYRLKIKREQEDDEKGE